MKTENVFFYGLCGLLSTTTTQATEKQKEVVDHKSLPNVVLILAYDVGYGDLSCFGATFYKTPNLDRMTSTATF
jgi:hypothetical protein